MTDGNQATPRTAIRDAILTGVSAELDSTVIRSLEDACLSATEAACRNCHPLLNFDEYREIAL
jgi:hypothetical protein